MRDSAFQAVARSLGRAHFAGVAALLGGALLIGSASHAGATIYVMDLTNVTLTDGGTVTGYYDFNTFGGGSLGAFSVAASGLVDQIPTAFTVAYTDADLTTYAYSDTGFGGGLVSVGNAVGGIDFITVGAITGNLPVGYTFDFLAGESGVATGTSNEIYFASGGLTIEEAIPEPGSLLMLGSAFAGCLMMRRRKA